MQTVTFTCLHCNNLMAVSTEFLGHQVHCPTCNQIVRAPAVAPAPIEATQSVAPMLEELSIESPRQETHESIFGETHDEDLFGTPPPKIEIPPGMPMATPSANGSSHTQFANYPPPSQLAAPAADAYTGFANPLVDNPPAAIGETTEMPTLRGGNPFEDGSAASPAPAATAEQFFNDAGAATTSPPPPPATENWAADEPAQKGSQPREQLTVRRPQDTLETQKSHKMFLMILLPYAVIMTLIAGYYAFKYFGGQSTHPLEYIPDVTPEYPRGSDKKSVKMPPPDQELPDKLKVPLGNSLALGDLEVTPERIEYRKIAAYQKLKGKAPTVEASPRCLVLTMRVKNASTDVWFRPTDGYFDRMFKSDPKDAPRELDRKNIRDNTPRIYVTVNGKREDANKEQHPYDFIDVGNKRFYGGCILHPVDHDKYTPLPQGLEREYMEGQENDINPLPPGEERRVVFAAYPKNGVANEAMSHKGPMIWRVLLRRGLVNYKGKDLSVCTVVGVEFNSSDIISR
jgi:phage FluMu protein Com